MAILKSAILIKYSTNQALIIIRNLEKELGKESIGLLIAESFTYFFDGRADGESLSIIIFLCEIQV